MSEKRIKKRLRTQGGFSIAEMLVTILILALVSGGLAGGIRFGMEQYNRSMQLSEAKILCSTLTSILREELSNTHEIWTDGETVSSFYSRHYADRSFDEGSRLAAVEPDVGEEREYGELAMMDVGGEGESKPLLSSASYTRFDLRVKPEVKYSDGVFTVTLKIRPKGASEDTLASSFCVLPLNDVQVHSST